MSKAVRASVLVLLLVCSAYAGDIQNGVTGTPPPPNVTQEERTADGDIRNGEPNSFTETVLSLLEDVLALF